MSVDAAGAPLMLSVSEVARMKGVSKEAVSKRVKRFEAQGLIATRTERGQKLVPLAEYDRLIDETTDFAKLRGETAPAAARAPARSTDENPVYVQEQARKLRYEADLKQIALKRQLGEIVAIADVERAMARCAEVIVRRIDRLPGLADELAGAVGKGGVDAARAWLRDTARDLRQALADSMRLLEGEEAAAGQGDDSDEEDA